MLTVLEMPVLLRRPYFQLYIWFFRCRLEEAAITDLRQYRSLSEFFRRSLRPGIRPVDMSSELVSNPLHLLWAVINNLVRKYIHDV